jgi:hypothetical protein
MWAHQADIRAGIFVCVEAETMNALSAKSVAVEIKGQGIKLWCLFSIFSRV